MYEPDLESREEQGSMKDQKLGSALFEMLGAPPPVKDRLFFDVFPLTLLTTSTLDAFQEAQPESRFDARRFRMNIVVKTSEPGFVENDWVGQQVAVGDSLRAQCTMLDSRCVMTTLDQEDLPRDSNVLRTIARVNRQQIMDVGKFPCAGVYAVVAATGSARVGDAVEIHSPA